MYKDLRGNAPVNLKNFKYVSDVHMYNTRSAANIFHSSCRTNYRYFSLKSAGTRV